MCKNDGKSLTESICDLGHRVAFDFNLPVLDDLNLPVLDDRDEKMTDGHVSEVMVLLEEFNHGTLT